MRNWRARIVVFGLGLSGWSSAFGQSMPLPAAPAVTAQQQAARSAAGQGVISADHVFDPQTRGRVTPTSHQYGGVSPVVCPICEPQPACPPCPYGADTQCGQCGDGYHSCLFNPDAKAYDFGDSLWEATGYETAPFDIGGWVQGGYHNKSDGLFNTHPNHFDAQQVNLYIERIADGSEGLDFGFRFDAMYGTDAPNTQAFGNPPGSWDFLNGFDHGVYGWAFPQLYGEVAYQDLSVKAGHFYTPVGYEVVTAPGNFFYSHAFTMNFSEPFTHTGVLGTYGGIEDVTLYGGWTLGWDTGFDQFNGGSCFVGGVGLSLLDNLTATYIATAGNLGWVGRGYTHSIVADYVISDDWEYVFQSDLVSVDSIGGGHYDTVGVNQYLFYSLTDGVKAGGRFEWWKQDGTSFYEATLGVNFIPLPNVRIRPEVRHQWSPAGDVAANNPFGIPVDQTIFGVDVVVTF